MLRSELDHLLTSTNSTVEEAVRLTAGEKRSVETQGILYAGIMAIDAVERLYAQGRIPSEAYKKEGEELLSQIRLLVSAGTTDLVSFIDEHCTEAVLARRKFSKELLSGSSPRAGQSNSHDDMVLVLESSQHFVTLVDALKMGLSHADELLPVVRDLYKALGGIWSLPRDFQATGVVKNWLNRLTAMKASESLTAEEVRQFSLDLDGAFSEFHAAVRSIGKSKRPSV